MRATGAPRSRFLVCRYLTALSRQRSCSAEVLFVSSGRGAPLMWLNTLCAGACLAGTRKGGGGQGGLCQTCRAESAERRRETQRALRGTRSAVPGALEASAEGWSSAERGRAGPSDPRQVQYEERLLQARARDLRFLSIARCEIRRWRSWGPRPELWRWRFLWSSNRPGLRQHFASTFNGLA